MYIPLSVKAAPKLLYMLIMLAVCCRLHSFPHGSHLRALLVTRDARGLVASWQDHGSPIDPVEGFGSDRGAVCADGGTNGHEEATVISQSLLAW